MKKLLLILTILLLFCPESYAQSENIALLTKKGFFEKTSSFSLNSCEEVRKIVLAHNKYANEYNFEGLKSLYSDTYMNSDGLGKSVYFDLIKKTWESYPDIKYKLEITDIEVSGDTAAVQVKEEAVANTSSKSGIVNEKGLLESSSASVYYLEKIYDKWFITSDSIIFEKTSLRYGSAKNLDIELSAPGQISANTDYTVALKLENPKDSIVIASIGRENITYPQKIADEVFRKLPEEGILERMFKSNNKNINEYAVASFGITKAEIKNSSEIKIYVTGLGFVMSRVNVIPENKYVKVDKDEKSE